MWPGPHDNYDDDNSETSLKGHMTALLKKKSSPRGQAS